jgi:hypothetical protein
MTQTIDQFLGDWTGAERTGDAGRLDDLLTDDFLGVGPLGFVLSKPATPPSSRPARSGAERSAAIGSHSRRSGRLSTWSATTTAGSSPAST